MKNAQRTPVVRPGKERSAVRQEMGPVGPHRAVVPLARSIVVWAAVLLLACPLSPWPATVVPASGNQPPVAVAGNFTIAEKDEDVFFHAHDSYDPDGEIVLYEWDFEGDGIYDWNSTENGTTFHAYHEERAYNATLRVTDNESASSTDVYFVIVQAHDEDDDDSRVKTLVYLVGTAEIIFGVSFVAMVWWWRRNLYSG